MKNLIVVTLTLATLFLSSLAQAKTVKTLMISINKTVPFEQVKDYVQRLEFRGSNAGRCYFHAIVSEYISYEFDPAAPYYGVALVDLTEVCAREQEANYMKWLNDEEARGVYTNYNNSEIEPAPVVGGRN
jgi:hypothetical protein